MEKNKVYQKKWNKQYVAVIAFFALFLLCGLLVFKDYGISIDEMYQRNHSLGAYKGLVPSVEGVVTETVDFSSVYSTPYGVLIQLPTVVAEHLKGFSLSFRQIYLIRHLYTFLVFYVSMICFYMMCCRFTKDKLLALVGPLMLILSPRQFAESFYNIKDLMCMSLMTISLFFGMRFLDRPNLWRLILLGISVLLCADSRIIGIVVLPAAILVMLLKGWRDGSWKRQLAYLLVAGGVGLALCWVILGKSPLDMFLLVWNKVTYFSNYAGWEGTNYYFGQYYEAGTNPRHYILVWIAITTPIAYLLFSLIGSLTTLRIIKHGDVYDQIFLMICMWVPLLYVLLLNPILYNGWRHFYFIYPEILLLAFYGLMVCLDKMKNPLKKQEKREDSRKSKVWVLHQYAPAIVMALSMLCTGWWMVRNHPYEYVYFNIWTQSFAHENFNKDYWHVSEDQAVREIIWKETAPVLQVSTLLKNNLYLLSPEESSRVNWLPLEKADQADYTVICYTEHPEKQKFEFWDMYEETDYVMVDGHKINSTFKRVYDVAAETALRISGEQKEAAYDISGGIRWNGDTSDGQLIGTLPQAVPSDRLHLDVNDAVPAESLSVFVSADGENWMVAENTTVTGYGITVDYAPLSVQYVKLEWDTSQLLSGVMWEIVFQVYCQRGVVPTMVEKAIASVKASHQSWEAVKAIDGTLETRWSCGVYQETGMHFEMTLKEVQRIAGLILDSSVSQWDRPVNLKIYVSLDGEVWNEIHAKNENMYTYLFEEPMYGKQIRLEIGELETVVPYNWSIDELYVLSATQK